MLAAIGDDDHAPARSRDDLFPQQRRTSALDQAQPTVEFVRAVDSKVEFGRLVEIGQGNALPVGLPARGLGSRYADDPQARREPAPRGETTKCGRRRAGAESDAHAVGHERHGAQRRRRASSRRSTPRGAPMGRRLGEASWSPGASVLAFVLDSLIGRGRRAACISARRTPRCRGASPRGRCRIP